MSDAFDEGLRATGYHRGIPFINFSLSLPVGPRSLKAGVSLAYEGQPALAFRSRVVWPTGDNYKPAIRAAIRVRQNS